jgi:O-6-methylguanine DNA methyltransferase
MTVWEHVLAIPFGQTRTYGALAEELGRPEAARAVGQAVGTNHLALLIPCHRVVPAAGGVGEYAWGSWRKEWLLRHEQQPGA